jgi:hypothetical protein
VVHGIRELLDDMAGRVVNYVEERGSVLSDVMHLLNQLVGCVVESVPKQERLTGEEPSSPYDDARKARMVEVKRAFEEAFGDDMKMKKDEETERKVKKVLSNLERKLRPRKAVEEKIRKSGRNKVSEDDMNIEGTIEETETIDLTKEAEKSKENDETSKDASGATGESAEVALVTAAGDTKICKYPCPVDNCEYRFLPSMMVMWESTLLIWLLMAISVILLLTCSPCSPL